MAWRSDSESNEELAEKLEANDLISSPHIIAAFRAVDRGFFVPAACRAAIYLDRPFRQELPGQEGALHMSAPHMYAMMLEALDISPDSGARVLNIGSGTGYMSSLLAFLVGTEGAVHGIEVFPAVVEYANSRFEEFAAQPLVPGMPHRGLNRDGLARDFKFMTGNALAIDFARNCEYDRVYVGAQGVHDDIQNLVQLLAPGGVLVGPFSDKLIRIKRAADGGSFTSEELTGVRFAELVRPAAGDSVIVELSPAEKEKETVPRLCAMVSIDAVAAKTLLKDNAWSVDAAAAAHRKAKAEAERKAKAEAERRARSEAVPPASAARRLAEGDPAAALSKQLSGAESVDAWLRSVKLQRYADAVKRAGYDDMQFLRDADLSEINEMLEDVEMKKPHAKTFRVAWTTLVGLDPSTVGGGAASSAASPPMSLAEPEPDAPTEGHGSVSTLSRASTLRAPPPAATGVGQDKIFGSMRFQDGRVLREATQLQAELKRQAALDLQCVNMSAGGDIDTEVFGGIERADTFLVFGTKTYGEDTGNPASTVRQPANNDCCPCVLWATEGACVGSSSSRSSRCTRASASSSSA